MGLSKSLGNHHGKKRQLCIIPGPASFWNTGILRNKLVISCKGTRREKALCHLIGYLQRGLTACCWLPGEDHIPSRCHSILHSCGMRIAPGSPLAWGRFGRRKAQSEFSVSCCATSSPKKTNPVGSPQLWDFSWNVSLLSRCWLEGLFTILLINKIS